MKGFSLLQIIIVMGLVGGSSVAMMELYSIAQKNSKLIEVNYEISETVAIISNLLSDPISCQNTFSGIDLSSAITIGDMPDDIKKQNNTISNFVEGKTLSTGLEIKAFSINFSKVENIAPNSYFFPLEVTFKRPKSSVLNNEKVKYIYINATTNASNQVIQCYGIGGQTSTWKRSSSNVNDLYYNGGNVGIGTDSPESSLDVRGRASIIGPLKINEDGTACDSSEEGLIKYNQTQKNLQFCDGAQWTNLISKCKVCVRISSNTSDDGDEECSAYSFNGIKRATGTSRWAKGSKYGAQAWIECY